MSFDTEANILPSSGTSTAVTATRPPIFSLEFLSLKWGRSFFLIITVQALICLAFEAYAFSIFQNSLAEPHATEPEPNAQYKTVPVFLSLFIFGCVYEFALAWDALRIKSTVQIIGVCIANIALLAYTASQIDQLHEAQVVLDRYDALKQDSLQDWNRLRPFLIAIPCVIALGTICLVFVAWKLYQEFAWVILREIGADYRMTKRYQHYQFYLSLLKFDFFFFLGFMIQFLAVVGTVTNAEMGITIAVIPITVCILIGAAYSTRREIRSGMFITILLYLGALSYFIFKLSRVYSKSHSLLYRPVRKSITIFAAVTILLILLTIANAIVCWVHFGKGLKQYIQPQRVPEKTGADGTVELDDVVQPRRQRMSID